VAILALFTRAQTARASCHALAYSGTVCKVCWGTDTHSIVCVRNAAIAAGKEDQSALRDVISMLRNTSNPQVEYIVRIMVKWAKENAVDVDR
jgi:hypothetical protein